MLKATLTEAHHFTLSRHHLDERGSTSQLLATVDALCGLQAQQLLSAELALWSRVAGYQRGWLEEALYRRRVLIHGWCMRGTLHIVPAVDWPLYREATKDSWLPWWRQTLRRLGRLSMEERQRLIHPHVMKALAEGPLTRRALRQRLTPHITIKDEELGLYALAKELCYLGHTIMGPRSGAETTLVRLDHWLPQHTLMPVNLLDARKHLFLRYLASYGPATLQDFAHFTGLPVSLLHEVLAAAEAEVEEVHISEVKGRFWLRREDASVLAEAGSKQAAPVRLLPKFDPLVLGHKDKTRILAPQHRAHVLRAAGDVAATVLIDGRVHGTWRYEKKGALLTVTVTPFIPFDSSTRLALEREVDELAKFFDLPSANLRITPVRP